MTDCAFCGEDAQYIKQDGGFYVCFQCIHDGKDNE